ncbi:hypothetical protein AB6805_00230 [Chitinophaga sp. RCC_12]|uniref:hypothetical protein n=1 Tax=Chitinophaga sp. RCC_12 TaxID=3239226 RepID=UPI00352693BA
MRILILIISTCLMISCQRQEHSAKQTNTDSTQYLLESLVEKFSLANDKMLADSNQLIFYYEKRFDTTLLVSFKKDADRIKVVVYQVAPPYYRNGGNLRGNQKSPQFFEGFSFSIDTATWSSTVRAATEILNTRPVRDDENSAFDGPTYLLAFNSKIRVNRNSMDDSLLSGYLSLLKNQFLHKYMEQKPMWRKES